jgi:hypothetical protein
MELAHSKEVKIIVDYYDLEVLIDETYGSNFELVAQEEANNDSSVTFTVEAKEPEYDWNKKELADFKANKTNDCSTRLILNDMCLRGIIEPGNYLINISW